METFVSNISLAYLDKCLAGLNFSGSLRDRKGGKRWGLLSCFSTLSECIFLERSIGILATKLGKGLRTCRQWSPNSTFNSRKETD